MTKLDVFVDALEDNIAREGVMAIDVRRIGPSFDQDLPDFERRAILIEMLRVWMEHRWKAGHPVSVDDCLIHFPDEQFSQRDVECLQFEENRQKESRKKSCSSMMNHASVEQLPATGTLWCDFELLAVLGVGAFAKVYLARQQGLAGRLVALKLTFRESYESQWLASLQHSAIVPIYSVHSLNGVYGICMPYLGNTTLADLIREIPKSAIHSKRSWWRSVRHSVSGSGKFLLDTIQQRHDQIDTVFQTQLRLKQASVAKRNQKLPFTASTGTQSFESNEVQEDHPKQTETISPAARCLMQSDYMQSVCWIGAQIADALAYAHRNGIIHSDVKPANILLAADGQPRLLDFNVSYQNVKNNVATGDSPFGGTIAYMSPEHVRAFEMQTSIDPQCDIYSLGVVLFEMLTGKLPSPGATHQEPCVTKRYNSSVSHALSAIVGKCLAANLTDRYLTAEALCDDLTAQFQHEPLVHQAEPSTFERFSKWCYVHPRLSSSLTVFSFLSIIVTILLTGWIARGSALERADWVRRINELKRRIPNSVSMLTSLEVAPELESDVAFDLNQTLGLISVKRGRGLTVDPRWNNATGVDGELIERVRDLVWLTSKHNWKQPLTVPDAILKLEPFDNESNHQSMLLMQQRKWMEAITLLQRKVRNNPRDYVAWWLLGNCCDFESDFDTAKQAYTACIALQPNAAAHFNRAWTRLKSAQVNAALEDYDQAISMDLNWHRCRLNKALAYQSLGRFEEAVVELNKAIDHGFETVSLYRLRGMLHASLGKQTEAGEDFQRALRCTPTTEMEWIDRGLIRLSIQPSDAVQDFESAFKHNPESLEAHMKLAHVYSEILNLPEKGLKHLDRYIELEPKQPTPRAGRAVLHARANRTDAALVDLRVLESLQPAEGIVQYQIACGFSLVAERTAEPTAEPIHLESGKSAFQWFVRAIELDSSIISIAMTDPDIQWMRGQSKFQEILNAINVLKSNSSPPAIVP